jgi:putative ABC transport system permease protein
MLSPRYVKVRRDLWMARSRVAMMLLAIVLSLTAVGAVLTTKAINDRELAANYLSTNPASATIELQGGIDPSMLDKVRAQPGVVDAAFRRTISARIRTADSDAWRPLMLFVVAATDPLRIATFEVEQGSWPPTPDTILVERDALRLMGADVGDTVTIKTPNGSPRPVRIGGRVHDPGLSPATEEDSAYGYVSDSALAVLGESPALDQVKLLVADGSSRQAIEQTAGPVAAWLLSEGLVVDSIQIPPPYQHPHQSQMDTLLFMFLVFGGVALVLSAILVASMMNQMLTQQIPQIGVLKVVGAGTPQVLQLYLIVVLLIATLATLISIPVGVALGQALAGIIASTQLNFNITSDAVPGWVYVLQVSAGLGVPVLVALFPLLKASRITVRQAVDERGVDTGAAAQASVMNRLLAGGWLPRSISSALRNILRRRARLALSVSLLTVAGAMFTAGLNTSAALIETMDHGVAIQGYDVEVVLNTPESIARIQTLLGDVEGVAVAESWPMTAVATTITADGIDVVSTYPDKGHRSFTLLAPPVDSQLTRFPVSAGRWLEPGDDDAVVLNQNGKAAFLPRRVGVGDVVRLSVDGRAREFNVVGIVTQELYPASAFVSQRRFAELTGQAGRGQLVQIVTINHDPETRAAVLSRVEQVLADAGVSVRSAYTISHYRAAVDAHVMVLIATLVVLAAVMGAVGLLGLASTMSINVLERTRELAVMQSIGASPAAVRTLVMLEGVLISAVSAVLGILVGLPLSLVEGTLIGGMSFNLALGLTVSPVGVVTWLVVAVSGAILATALPALRASRITIREALAYV